MGDSIREAFEKTGLEPVVFDKPLKSISALVKFQKRIEPENIVQIHRMISFGFSAAIRMCPKSMYEIKSFNLSNNGKEVQIEMVAAVSYLAFEDDHETWFDDALREKAEIEYRGMAYHWHPVIMKWDSVERVSPIRGGMQTKGDGKITRKLND